MVGHASIYATGNILRQLVGFLMLPIYTRFLSPSDYGVVGLVTFALSLSELIFGARIGQALTKYYFDAEGKQARAAVVSTAMLLTGTVSAVGAALLILFSNYVSQGLYGTPEHAVIVAFFSVKLLTQALESYALMYIRFQQRPWFYVSINLSKLVVQFSLNIWLVVLLEMGVMGVAVSAMVSSSLFALLMVAYTVRHVGCRFKRSLAVKMLSFSWPLWLSGFAGLYIGMSNRYFIRIFSSLDEVGLFELAVKFSTIISLLVWSPFAKFWQVERFRYYHQTNAKPVFQNVFEFISTLLVLAALGIAVFAGPVIRVMADTSFHHAAVAVPFLAYSAVFGSLITFSNFSFLVKEKTGWLSRNQYLAAIIITVLYLAFIPIAGFVGAALAVMLAKASQFLIVHQSGRRFYDMGISLKPLAVKLFVSAIACFGTNYAFVRESIYEDIALKLLIYTIASILIVLPLLKNPSTRNLLNELKPAFMRKAKTG